MGFLKKIGRGIKKFASFTGKVVKGFAKGGIVGAGSAFVSNLGSGSSKPAQKASFASDSNLYASALPGFDVDVRTDAEKKRSRWLIGGIIALGLVVLGFLTGIFKRKR
jgi:hypothetical protein